MGVLTSCSTFRNGFADRGDFGRADGRVYPGDRQYPDDREQPEERLGVLNKGRFGLMEFCLTTGEANVAMIDSSLRNYPFCRSIRDYLVRKGVIYRMGKL